MPRQRPALTIPGILDHADRHRRLYGQWPHMHSGPVAGVPGESWKTINHALLAGRRGLPGGSSLRLLLVQKRDMLDRHKDSRLTIRQILKWADEVFAKTRKWPTAKTGKVLGAPAEKWESIDRCLRKGLRGLPGKTSLARLLAKHRGKPNHRGLPRLTHAQILKWADDHQRRRGSWPTGKSGPIPGAPAEDWRRIGSAMACGKRGLRPAITLPRLLAKHRGVRMRREPPPLSIPHILRWADAYYRRVDRWPQQYSGPIPQSPDDTWAKINYALHRGSRGLLGGITLHLLLKIHRSAVVDLAATPLTVRQILKWADEHRARVGSWPTVRSGGVQGAPGENWRAIDSALWSGVRGLGGNTTLADLLIRHTRVGLTGPKAPYSIAQVLAWADAYFEKWGRRPSRSSGAIPGTRRETWRKVDSALKSGVRGFPGGSSLSRFLARHR